MSDSHSASTATREVQVTCPGCRESFSWEVGRDEEVGRLRELIREGIRLMTYITNDGSDHEWITKAAEALKARCRTCGDQGFVDALGDTSCPECGDKNAS